MKLIIAQLVKKSPANYETYLGHFPARAVFSECDAMYPEDYSLPVYNADNHKGCNLHTQCRDKLKSHNVNIRLLHTLLTRICEYSASLVWVRSKNTHAILCTTFKTISESHSPKHFG
jgi:hypothetical protein